MMKLAAAVLTLTVGICLLIGFSRNRTENQVVQNAVNHGLESCYEAALKNGTNGNALSVVFETIVKKELARPLNERRLLPSIINGRDVFFSKKVVRRGSVELMCAVRAGGGWYVCIDGTGTHRLLKEYDLTRWVQQNS